MFGRGKMDRSITRNSVKSLQTSAKTLAHWQVAVFWRGTAQSSGEWGTDEWDCWGLSGKSLGLESDLDGKISFE